MTVTEPVYASTSASVSETSGQRQQFNGVSPFIQQQFPAQVSDTIQLPSSSQVLHIRASDGSEVQSDQGSINEEISTRQSGLTSEAILKNQVQELYNCTVCDHPIRDRYLYKVLEQCYHEACLKCVDCNQPLQNSCYSKEGHIYCRDHFFRRFGPKCSRCSEVVAETDVVRKANGHVYHLDCFKCVICKNKLTTGDQFYLIPMDGRLVCRADYENSSKETDMDGGGNKRPRTTISAKSLETLKQAYQNSSKPARHVREQLAAETGLETRVVQVWFQNRRAKEKRLKKDAGRQKWPASALFNRTIDSDSGSNDESLTGRSPPYGATFVENSSDMELHSEVGYGEYFGTAWTPLSRYSSEEHNYNMASADPSMGIIGGVGMMIPAPIHPSLEHNVYGEINPATNPIQLPHSVASSMMVGCGLNQSASIFPPYMAAPSQHHGISMMSAPIGISDLPPYSH